jgi:VacB/RNase II family 3'-5' exoribonuclease
MHTTPSSSSETPEQSPARKLEPGVPQHMDEGFVNESEMCIRGAFRAHPGKRSKGYCSVQGVRYDVLLSNESRVNRAIHGDTIDVLLDDFEEWPLLCEQADEPGNSVKPGPEFRATCAADPPDMGNAEATTEWTQNGSRLPSSAANERKLTLVQRADKQAQAGKRPIGRVVRIHEKSRSRSCIVGFVKIPQPKASSRTSPGSQNNNNDSKPKTMLFAPREDRYPLMRVDGNTLRKNTEVERALLGCESPTRMLFSARIKRWNADSDIPLCEISSMLGNSGDFNVEKAALAAEFQLPSSSFSERIHEDVDKLINAPIDEDELLGREEVQGFSIDPSSAKDLDDCVGCERLDERTLKVQVTIADVSYYVREGTALDAEAQYRATSVYYMGGVLPMLPPQLSEHLCSLNKHTTKYAFTFEFIIDEDTTDVARERFFKSLLLSEAQISYEMAQAVIDGSESAEAEEIPKNVQQQIRELHALAQKRKQKRFETGSLRLENPKLCFTLDSQGYPSSFSVEQRLPANELVEEMMLLANMRVARKIARHFKDSKRALLRRHPPPDQRKLEALRDFCNKHNIALNAETSLNLHSSLRALQAQDERKFEVVQLSATKPMMLAQYFCINDYDNEEDWKHYALNFPFYTHATSPIRRYADIVVHRLLTEAVCSERDKIQSSDGDADSLTDFALRLNERKLAGNSAEAGGRRFFLCHILSRQPVIVDCTVTSAGTRTSQLYVRKTGETMRVTWPITLRESDDSQDPIIFAEEHENEDAVTLRWRDGEPPELLDSEELTRRGQEMVSAMQLAKAEGMNPLQLPVTLSIFDAVPGLLHARFPEGKAAEMFLAPAIAIK